MISFEEFDARLDELVRPAKQPPPPVVYHYTAAAGLEGILESGEFWATHCRDTNDTTELRHGDESVRAVVTKFARNGSILKRRILNRFLADYQRKAFPSYVTSYLVCFSETDALLNQWVRYADDGFGYAIGFVPGSASSDSDDCNPGVGVELFKVEYDTAVLQAEFEEGVAAMLTFLDRLEGQGELSTRFENTFEGALFRRATYVSARCKHDAFQTEREWRLLAFPEAEADLASKELVRDVRGSQKRYIRLRINTDEAAVPISRIVVGPSHVAAGTESRAAESARDLLRDYNARGPACSVDVCAIPYRGTR